MNYKDTLFFIGKSLTIANNNRNKINIEETLQNSEINWETVVKVSTAHYVLPAIYCNYKKMGLLDCLPKDLVIYMEHITNLNRERNKQIITQAKAINELLLTHNITPIFLKGTGNLLDGLYNDIAERMIGDIDFIVSRNEYDSAQSILFEFGYEKVHKTTYDFPEFKHFPKLHKENEIAAIELHKQLLTEEHASEFNFETVKKDIQIINGISFLSFEHQLALSVFAKQLNDNGMHFKSIALRNSYDTYLLSTKINTLNTISKFDKLSNALNSYLAITSEVFEKPDSLLYHRNERVVKYLNDFLKYLENPELNKKFIKKKEIELFIKSRLDILKKVFFRKEHRDWFFKRISDKKWQQEKLVQLGLKKTKSNS